MYISFFRTTPSQNGCVWWWVTLYLIHLDLMWPRCSLQYVYERQFDILYSECIVTSLYSSFEIIFSYYVLWNIFCVTKFVSSVLVSMRLCVFILKAVSDILKRYKKVKIKTEKLTCSFVFIKLHYISCVNIYKHKESNWKELKRVEFLGGGGANNLITL